MKLHEYPSEFSDLTELTAEYIGIPSSAVKRDYYIVMMLQKLERSCYADTCIFKGGTSLSKCYPGSIERFSEDIDLTYLPNCKLNDKGYDRELKRVEEVMSEDFRLEKIPGERNHRNKSSFVWFDESSGITDKIKLEIGSSIHPDPYSKRSLHTYIQDFLFYTNKIGSVKEYDLQDVTINVLDIERTFLDKVMAVKRHAICGDICNKVRHIYDVTMLYKRGDIQLFLLDTERLKYLLRVTKETNIFYLQKRNIDKTYNPAESYCFESWKKFLGDSVQVRYENLHKDLLYTNKKQDFSEAIDTFQKISDCFKGIGE